MSPAPVEGADGRTGGPLAGVRVIDLSQMLAGPYCTMILADLGADVVKIEPPGGDPARVFGPFHPDDELRAFGGYFQSINRNKRSIVLDLKDAEGLAVFDRLLDDADILVENYRFGVMERLERSYEILHESWPRLVYASIRGYGDRYGGESPRADWPAYDLTAQALGGFMGITGLPELPLKSGPGLGDVFPAVTATVGVLAALHERGETGKGRYVDIAMYDAVLALCERIVHQHSYTGSVPGRQGNDHPLLCPFDVFRAADGWVTIASPSDSHWRTLCHAIGRPEMGDDPRFARNEDRLERAGEVRDVVGGWTASRTRAQILDVLGGRFPIAPVNDVADIFADPHVAARGMTVPLEHPGVAEPLEVAGSPIKLSGNGGDAYRRAPILAEHASEILAEAGYDEAEVARLLGVPALGAESEGCSC